ncbi:MAG: histidine kinase N-terminal 7TM domain-containing protein [Promethearchaeota archaeon]
MAYELSVYALIMGMISLLAISLGSYAFFFRPRSRVAIHFLLMVAATACWCVGYFLELAATDENTMMFWNYFQYLGILTLPPLLLLFILIFTQRYEITSKPFIGLFFFPPFVHYIFLLTNDTLHSFFYLSVGVQISDLGSSLDLAYGPLFYTNVIYSYILLAIGYYLLIHTYLSTSETNLLYKKQLQILIFGTTVPIIGNIIRIFYLIPSLDLDLTPTSFVIAYIVFAYALYGISFLDIVPIARQRVFEEILDGIVVIDRDWRVIDLNSAAHDILLPRLELSEIYGKNIFPLLKAEILQKAYNEKIDEVQHGLEELQTGTSSMYSTEFDILVPQDVPKKFYDLLASPLRSPSNRDILGFVVILRDITDHVTAELTFQQKNRMQDLILKLLSHDLYNHLNVLDGYTEIAAQATDLEGTKEGLLAIRVKSNATMRLIEEVTAYLKVEDVLRSSPTEKYELIGAIQAAIKQLQPEINAKKLSVELKLLEGPAYILANLAMNSVILNLIANAIKFSPPQGIIEICLIDTNNDWQVSIADQGSGIPDGLKKQVFEPFAAFGEQKGIGLGLTIAFQAIQFFLGRMWIEDAKPQGTIFYFEIPKRAEN